MRWPKRAPCSDRFSGLRLAGTNGWKPSLHRGIWVLVLAFLILGTTYSVITPLFEASDEMWHYPFVQHLAGGGGLPVQDPANLGPWRQEGCQPPLYYGLAALVTRWVPSDDLPQLPQRNPHADIGLIRRDGNANMVIHTPQEGFPFRGAVLAVHLARGLSVLLGALTVLFTYLAGLEILPRRPELALAAAAVAAFTPMFLFIAGSVNNDNLLVTLSTASFWLLLRQLRLPSGPGRWLLIGAVIGLAALSKVSALALLGPAGLVLAWVAWRRRDWKSFFRDGVCLVGAAALVAGWWYYRNWRLYGDPLGFNVFVAIAGPRFPKPTLRQLLGEWKGFVMAYWGLFGGVNVAAPEWFYNLLNGLAVAALAGLGLGVARRVWQRRLPDADTAFRLGLVAAYPLMLLVSLVRWTLLTIASQGRLIFPAIGCLSFLLVLGLSSLGHTAYCLLRKVARSNTHGNSEGYASRITHYGLAFLAPVVMAALALWTPFGIIRPAYARPPLLTEAELAAIPERLDLSFDGRMELLGYSIETEAVRPGQEVAVTLYWRALAPMEHNYSVFVHLLADNELIIGQRDVYPGCGSFPTTLWQPGDAIADTYIIPVSPTAFSPSHAQVEVGLYRVDTGERLPVYDGSGQAVGDNARFGDLLVRAEPRDGIANPVDYNLGDKVALIGYDMDRTALRAGETLHLTLIWKALAPMDKNYTVFTQVLDPNQNKWGQKDAWPLDGAAPTSAWQAGQVVEDHYEITINPETPAGAYDIQVGMYLGETGRRLPILAPDGRVQDDRILLNRLRVLPAEG